MLKTSITAIIFSIFTVSPSLSSETITPGMQLIIDLLLASNCSMPGQEAVTKPDLEAFEGGEIRNLVSEMIEMGIVTLRSGDNLHLTDPYCPS